MGYSLKLRCIPSIIGFMRGFFYFLFAMYSISNISEEPILNGLISLTAFQFIINCRTINDF